MYMYVKTHKFTLGQSKIGAGFKLYINNFVYTKDTVIYHYTHFIDL